MPRVLPSETFPSWAVTSQGHAPSTSTIRTAGRPWTPSTCATSCHCRRSRAHAQSPCLLFPCHLVTTHCIALSATANDAAESALCRVCRAI
eukprot:6204917-Pleurochrysis_carterae.AAC.1